MKYVNALLQYPKEIPQNHVYMFTANKTVMSNGELIMGGGNALAFRKAYPHSPLAIGMRLRERSPQQLQNLSLFFLDARLMKAEGLGILGCMFTKHNPANPSPFGMVKKGILDLDHLARHDGKDFTFHLPYPGCGLGGLHRKDLDPLVERLPDNVIVYVV